VVTVTILTPEARTTDLALIFRIAADVIERNGLAKGAFVAPPSVPDASGVLHASDPQFRPVDMVGAIRIACGMDPTESGGFTAMAAIKFASLHMRGEAPWTDGEPDYIEHLADFTDLTPCVVTDVSACLTRLAIEAGVESPVRAA
jgi:hypothetical protein